MSNIPPVEVQLVAKGAGEVMSAFRSIAQATERFDQASVTSANQASKARVRAAEAAAKEETKIKVAQLKAEAQIKMKSMQDSTAMLVQQARISAWSDIQGAKIAAGINRKRVSDAEQAEKDITRAKEREAAKQQRIEERANKVTQREQEKQKKARVRMAGVAMGGAVSGVNMVAGAAKGVLATTGLLGGFDVANQLAIENRNQAHAVDISNSGFGDGHSRVDPKDIMAASRKTAIKYGMGNESEVLSGLEGFTGQSGELQLGIDLLDEMGKVAKGTGANFQDIANAMGAMKADMPNMSIKDMSMTLRTFAAQGQLGATELKDVAGQFGKIAAAANSLGPDKAKNMAMVGAVIQVSRAGGGSISASEAANSVLRFQGDAMKKAARFKQLGVEVYNKDGSVRDTGEIIRDAVVKSKGSAKSMSELGVGIMGQRALKGFATTYRDAEAKEKGTGESAVKKEFDKFMSAVMSDEKLDESVKLATATAESKLNASMTELRAAMAEELIPELNKLVPLFKEFVPHVRDVLGALSKLISFARENPFSTAFAGIGLMVGKAILQEMGSAAISKMVGQGIGGIVGQFAGQMTPAAAGIAGAIIGVSLAIIEAGKFLINEAAAKDSRIEGAVATGGSLSEEQQKAITAVNRGTATPADIAMAKGAEKQIRSSIAASDDNFLHPGVISGIGQYAASKVDHDAYQTGVKQHFESSDRAASDANKLSEAIARATANLDKLSTSASAASPDAANRNVPTTSAQRGGATH